ncbi:hypothetical protein B0H11DRAFT_2024445, partial [Mycena galericulata]
MAQTNIPSLLKTLQIPSRVRTVYLVGSRLWGTNSPKSDFDLLIVVEDPPPYAQLQKSQHKNQYDATLLSETSFRRRVNEGSFIESICCLIPESEDCVLFSDATPRRELIPKSHLQSIRTWSEERRKKDMEKAMKFWAKCGDAREKGWKILQYSIEAECILQGLEAIIDEDKIDLRDVFLDQQTLHQFVETGKRDGDRDWLGLDWAEVLEAHGERIKSVLETYV